MKFAFIGSVLSLGLTPFVLGAPVTWVVQPTSIVDESALDQNGQLVHAGTWGTGARSVSINGETIQFENALTAGGSSPNPGTANAIATASGENSSGSYFSSTGSPSVSFEAVMDSFAFDGNDPKAVVLNNLTVGQVYEVQLLASDDRSFGLTRRQLWSDSSVLNGAGANQTAQFAHSDSVYVVGRFTADAVTQTLYGHGVNTNATVVNGYVLRTLSSPAVPTASADLNNNGIPDLSELVTPQIAQFPPATDSDGDGVSNLQEALAGTNAFDPESFFRVKSFIYTDDDNNQLSYTFTSVPNVRYCIEVSDSLEGGDWMKVDPSYTATSELSTVVYDEDSLGLGDRAFFRASVLPSVDTDSDGLEDSLELYLGYDPNNSASVRSASAGGDQAQYMELLQGGDVNGGMFNSTVPGVPSEAQASRFLSQAAFGPTPEAIAALRALGDNAFEKWIDQQMTETRSETLIFLNLIDDRIDGTLANDGDYSENTFLNPNLPYGVRKNITNYVHSGNYRTAVFRFMLFAPDQLRQRMTSALLKILVADAPDSLMGARQRGRYRDLLSSYALGEAGNFGDLLFEVSRSPLMGFYLSHRDNLPANPNISRMPDENFAREIMQLFSIGLWELNPDGTFRLDANGERIATYGNEDVTQMARVFTGFRFSANGGFPAGNDFWDQFASPGMAMVDFRHDRGLLGFEEIYGTREKVFLQGPFYNPPVLPAFEDDPGRTGLDDVRDACNILLNHPNCPPFISKLLIQHLVTSNPTPEYVLRVSNVFMDDGNGVRGNLGAVAKAILLDPEARSLASLMDESHGKLKAPILRSVSLARGFNVGEGFTSLYGLLDGLHLDQPRRSGGGSLLGVLGESFGERFPSVFSFYSPDYSLPGELDEEGLVSPEFEILNSERSISTPNQLWDNISRGFEFRSQGNAPATDLDLTEVNSLIGTPELAIDYLNELLCHGTMGSQSRAIILDTLAAASGSTQQRSELAVYLVATCGEAAVLR